MGSEQVTTDTVRLPFSALFSLITNFCSPKCLIMNLADCSLLVQVMVPDNMVGLIIGRGGEQITRLQVVPENFQIFAGLKKRHDNFEGCLKTKFFRRRVVARSRCPKTARECLTGDGSTMLRCLG